MSDSNGQGQLGTIVSWRVPSTVSLGDLRQALVSAGLDPTLAGDMAPRNALRRALRDMKEGRVIRQLRREGDKLWFQFTAEHLSKYEASYDKEAELSLDVSTSDVWCSVPELQDEASRLLNENLQKRLTSDLTRLVQKVYDARRADLVPIREQGGAYFVPDMHREVVEKSRTLLGAIGGNLRSFDVRLGSADTAESVAESLAEYLRGLITEYRDSTTDVTKDTRTGVLNRRAGTSKEIRRRIECYASIMGTYRDQLVEEMAEADRQFVENLKREALVV